MQTGPPLEVYRQPANRFVAQFIGSPGMNFLPGTTIREQGQTAFHIQRGSNSAVVLPLPEPPTWLHGDQTSREVTLGIRPEAIEVLAGREGTTGPDFHETAIEVSEPLGHETLLYMRLAGVRLTARVPGNQMLSEPGRAKLRFRLEQASWFDPRTHQALD